MSREEHNLNQRHYYESVDHARIAIGDTRYIRAHVERMIETAGLTPAQSILEVGSGPGKFTLQMSARGYRITANDLSPHLLQQLDRAAGGKVPTICCDVHDIARQGNGRYGAVIGFFVLHHLIDFPALFRTLSEVLEPGGRIAFCEPVGVNPLYYLQILLAPNMSFSGEPSMTKMRPAVMLPAMREAGFVDAEAIPYGYFPPFLKNSAWGDRLEVAMERSRFIPFPRAFQIFTARLPG